ncbi:hypothetical protein [Streptomyces sp. NPDC040750]|uniref:hypothetical protein n=1 Tax=Streptomyces sp. NPDC040750 TaxID=3154491 RepID=UPI0033EFEA5C
MGLTSAVVTAAPRSGLLGRLCRQPVGLRLIRHSVLVCDVTDSNSTRPHRSLGLPPQPEPQMNWFEQRIERRSY